MDKPPRRSSLEIDIAVLQVLSESTNPMKLTHIMYRANVNAKILKEKLAMLEAKRLIEMHKSHYKNHLRAQGKDHILFGLTVKGLSVLRSYLSVYDVLGRVEIEQ